MQYNKKGGRSPWVAARFAVGEAAKSAPGHAKSVLLALLKAIIGHWKLILLAVFLSSVYATGNYYLLAYWFGLIVAVDIIFLILGYKKWFTPTLRMIETAWHGKPLEKQFWTEEERERFKRTKRRWVWRKKK